MFLYLLSWITAVFHISLVVFAISKIWLKFLITYAFLASSLYYLAELIEEYTAITKRITKYCILLSVITLVLLWIFEDLPNLMIIFALLSNFVYLLQLASFPFFQFSSPVFLATVVSVILNHYFAFNHFATTYYPFSEIMAYFTVCVWLVPFIFFISLSANDSVLPTTMSNSEYSPLYGRDDDIVSNYLKRKQSRMGLLAFFDYMKKQILPAFHSD